MLGKSLFKILAIKNRITSYSIKACSTPTTLLCKYSAVCLVSVSWHWIHMYKTAWANKRADLLRHQDVPLECRSKLCTAYTGWLYC